MMFLPGRTQFLPACAALLLLLAANSPAAVKPVAPAKAAAPLVALRLHVRSDEEAKPETLHLRGPDARQQLLVTARRGDGSLEDFTRQAAYDVIPKGIVRVDKSGLVTPLADGTATITAKSAESA